MVPELRFPEFTQDWESIKLADVFDRVTRKNTENNQNILTISAQHGLVSQEKFFSKIVAAKDVTKYYLLHKDDYAYNKSYSNGYPMGAIKRLILEDKGVVSTLYICFSAKEKGYEGFYDQYFESGRHNVEIEKIAQEGARNHGLLNMSVGDFFLTSLTIPSAEERKKIAAFLSVTDEKILALENKTQMLQDYKRSVAQELFNQKARFTGDDGSDYPEWEFKRLDQLFEEVNRKVGEAKVETYSITAGKGFVSQAKKFGKDISGKQNARYTLLHPNELSYNKGNSKSYKYGCVYANHLETPVAVPNVFISFKPKDKGSVVNFYEQLFIDHYLDRSLRKIISSGARMDGLLNVNKVSFFKITVPMPAPEEQKKIADFLLSIDEKIDRTKNETEKVKLFKKALLQRMFV